MIDLSIEYPSSTEYSISVYISILGATSQSDASVLSGKSSPVGSAKLDKIRIINNIIEQKRVVALLFESPPKTNRNNLLTPTAKSSATSNWAPADSSSTSYPCLRIRFIRLYNVFANLSPSGFAVLHKIDTDPADDTGTFAPPYLNLRMARLSIRWNQLTSCTGCVENDYQCLERRRRFTAVPDYKWLCRRCRFPCLHRMVFLPVWTGGACLDYGRRRV